MRKTSRVIEMKKHDFRFTQKRSHAFIFVKGKVWWRSLYAPDEYPRTLPVVVSNSNVI